MPEQISTNTNPERQSMQPSSASFTVGSLAQLKGLRVHEEYNGKLVRIVEVIAADASSERGHSFKVKLTTDESVFQVFPENLLPTDHEESDEEESDDSEEDESASPATSSKAGASRQDLVRELYDMLDVDDSGKLAAREFLVFASLCGFEGTAEEWAQEYKALCNFRGWDTEAGATLDEFEKLVSDKSFTAFCEDEELLEMIAELEKHMEEDDEAEEIEGQENTTEQSKPRSAERHNTDHAHTHHKSLMPPAATPNDSSTPNPAEPKATAETKELPAQHQDRAQDQTTTEESKEMHTHHKSLMPPTASPNGSSTTNPVESKATAETKELPAQHQYTAAATPNDSSTPNPTEPKATAETKELPSQYQDRAQGQKITEKSKEIPESQTIQKAEGLPSENRESVRNSLIRPPGAPRESLIPPQVAPRESPYLAKRNSLPPSAPRESLVVPPAAPRESLILPPPVPNGKLLPAAPWEVGRSTPSQRASPVKLPSAPRESVIAPPAAPLENAPLTPWEDPPPQAPWEMHEPPPAPTEATASLPPAPMAPREVSSRPTKSPTKSKAKPAETKARAQLDAPARESSSARSRGTASNKSTSPATYNTYPFPDLDLPEPVAPPDNVVKGQAPVNRSLALPAACFQTHDVPEPPWAEPSKDADQSSNLSSPINATLWSEVDAASTASGMSSRRLGATEWAQNWIPKDQFRHPGHPTAGQWSVQLDPNARINLSLGTSRMLVEPVTVTTPRMLFRPPTPSSN
jgi:hypothetical protein